MKKPRPLDLDPSVYLREDYVVLDFETTNLDKGNPTNRENRLVLACWSRGPTHRKGPGLRSCFGSEYEQRELLEDIQDGSFIVAHNAKFELGWLIRCGLEPRDLIVWCTQIGEFVLAGNRRLEGGLSLDETAGRYGIKRKLQYVQALLASGVCPSIIERGDLKEYCERDIYTGRDIFLHQRRRTFGHSLQNVQYGRCLQTPMLADIEQRGVQLDEGRVRVAHQSTLVRASESSGELEKVFGVVNWDSPKQKRELLYSRLGFEEATDYRGKPIKTNSGAQSTADDTISLLKARTDTQRLFLRLWGKQAGLSKEVQSLESMLGCVEEDKGRLYAGFNQTICQNHRLSSTGGKWGLQFQNFPRHLRSLFCSREGTWYVVDGDCPQLEFRVATDLGNDGVARADILNRIDVHNQTASVIGCGRQDAKEHTFGPLYGKRKGPPAHRAYYDFFREKYKGIYDTQMSWVYHVLEHKQLTTATGLVFYWPDTEVTRSGYITNTPSIFNYPVSMFATADISQLSLLLVWHNLRGMDSFIVNTVHDSGVLEVPPEELDRVREIMVYCYTEEIYGVLDRLYGYSFATPLGLGIKVGHHWGEAANDEKYESSRFQFAA